VATNPYISAVFIYIEIPISTVMIKEQNPFQWISVKVREKKM